MKGNSNDEDGLRKMTSDKGAKMLLPSVMVGRCGNTERQEVKPHFLPKSEQILPHRHPCHFFPGGDSVSSRDGALKDRPWKGHRGAGVRGQWAGRCLQLGVRGLRVRARWLPEGVGPGNTVTSVSSSVKWHMNAYYHYFLVAVTLY